MAVVIFNNGARSLHLLLGGVMTICFSNWRLATDQQPLERQCCCTYTYSSSALNHSESPWRSGASPRAGGVGLTRCIRPQMFALPPPPPRTLQISRGGRYEKCTIKPFEISIVIMSCLLSLESRVTFHTGESRGSLRREEKSDCQANMRGIFFWRRLGVSLVLSYRDLEYIRKRSEAG